MELSIPETKPSAEAALTGEGLKVTPRGLVVRGGDGWIYKLLFDIREVDNELSHLIALWPSGYVPYVVRLTDNLIAVQDLGEREKLKVTDAKVFLSHLPKVIEALNEANVCHGDLQIHNVLVVDNKPMLIDFGGSRRIGEDKYVNYPDDRARLKATMDLLVKYRRKG